MPAIDLTLNCRGKILSLEKPVVMGILNLTPDSFFDGGAFTDEHAYLSRVEKMVTGGASIIDVGGQSTRPGAVMTGPEEEMKRILDPIRKINARFPLLILSVDTFHARVAEEAVLAGASMVNDISAGESDPAMTDMIKKLRVPYIIMHMKGTPATMQQDPRYDDVFEEVFNFLKKKVLALKEKGIHDVIIDPGFGFGKTTEHNFTLLKRLADFKIIGKPLLAGVSRKSMINKVLRTSPGQALNGTTVLHTLALQNGANILRAHDVEQAMETIKLTTQYELAPF